MEMITSTPPEIVLSQEQIRVLVKTIEIGAWDMRVGSFKMIAGTFNVNKILEVSAVVFHDAGAGSFPLTYSDGAGHVGGRLYVSPTQVTIYSTAGGPFDQASYSNVGINRGYIIVRYFD